MSILVTKTIQKTNTTKHLRNNLFNISKVNTYMTTILSKIIKSTNTNTGNAKIYTINKNESPYMVQYSKANTTRSCILAFTDKNNADEFAALLESYYKTNYLWPQFMLDNKTNFNLYIKQSFYDEIELDILDIESWNNSDLTSYCLASGIDLAILKEDTNSNTINTNKFVYKTQIYGLKSSIENERNICEAMYYL